MGVTWEDVEEDARKFGGETLCNAFSADEANATCANAVEAYTAVLVPLAGVSEATDAE